jgi:hypothetical protein
MEDRTRAYWIVVHEQIDGSIRIVYKGQAVRFRKITTRPLKKKATVVPVERTTPHRPSANHPWRDFKFGRQRYKKRKAIPNAG